MPTKADLQWTIERLEIQVRKYEKALRELGEKVEAMEIVAPKYDYSCADGAGPYLGDGKGFGYLVTHKICGILDRIAINDKDFRLVGHTSTLDLFKDGRYSLPSRKVYVPRVAGEALIEILEGVSELARNAYNQGLKDGSDMLRGLVSGDITPDKFDDDITRRLGEGGDSYRSFRTREAQSREIMAKDKKG